MRARIAAVAIRPSVLECTCSGIMLCQGFRRPEPLHAKMLKDILREEARVCNLEMKKVGRRKTAKHAQRGTGFGPETLSLCRPTRGGHVYDCNLNWKVRWDVGG